MSDILVSPSAMIDIIDRIEKAIWEKYSSYKNASRYIKRWHKVFSDDYGRCCDENFTVILNDKDQINLSATLDTMGDELLMQIAVDLGIEVPGLIYAVAEIKGVLADRYENVGDVFNKAFEKVASEPAAAVMMANSALELIIKRICSDDRIEPCNSKLTLYKLTQHILKQFKLYPDKDLNGNLRNIASGLISVAQAVENIRSENTNAHGTDREIIDNPLYAMFILNSVSTVGLFLLNYYEIEYPVEIREFDDEIPF